MQFISRIILILVLCSFLGKAQGLTAKDAYSYALPYAEKFSSDTFVYLINFSYDPDYADLSLDPTNGESKTWDVMFYSPSKDLVYGIRLTLVHDSVVVDSIVAHNDFPPNAPAVPIVSNWVDSPVILHTAFNADAADFSATHENVHVYWMELFDTYWVLELSSDTDSLTCMFGADYGDQITCDVDVNLGISAIGPPRPNNLTIYPNPASVSQGGMKVSYFSKTREDATLMLFDLSGKLLGKLYTGQIAPGQNTFAVTLPSTVRPGLYFIGARIGKRFVTRKILIHP